MSQTPSPRTGSRAFRWAPTIASPIARKRRRLRGASLASVPMYTRVAPHLGRWSLPMFASTQTASWLSKRWVSPLHRVIRGGRIHVHVTARRREAAAASSVERDVIKRTFASVETARARSIGCHRHPFSASCGVSRGQGYRCADGVAARPDCRPVGALRHRRPRGGGSRLGSRRHGTALPPREGNCWCPGSCTRELPPRFQLLYGGTPVRLA
jgi:hypothetical protein